MPAPFENFKKPISTAECEGKVRLHGSGYLRFAPEMFVPRALWLNAGQAVRRDDTTSRTRGQEEELRTSPTLRDLLYPSPACNEARAYSHVAGSRCCPPPSQVRVPHAFLWLCMQVQCPQPSLSPQLVTSLPFGCLEVHEISSLPLRKSQSRYGEQG